MDVHFRRNEKPLKFEAELFKGDWYEGEDSFKFSMSTPLKLLSESGDEMIFEENFRLFVSKELCQELEENGWHPAAHFGDYYVTVYVDMIEMTMKNSCETTGYYFKLLDFEAVPLPIKDNLCQVGALENQDCIALEVSGLDKDFNFFEQMSSFILVPSNSAHSASSSEIALKDVKKNEEDERVEAQVFTLRSRFC